MKTGSVRLPEASGIKTEQRPVLSISKVKTDFNISGQIGDISQKDRLRISSLVHQMENGLKIITKKMKLKKP